MVQCKVINPPVFSLFGQKFLLLMIFSIHEVPKRSHVFLCSEYILTYTCILLSIGKDLLATISCLCDAVNDLLCVLISRVAQLQQYEERRLKEFEDALNREAVSTAVTMLL